MIKDQVTMDRLLAIPAFNKAFEYQQYKDVQESFLQNINKGSEIAPSMLLGLLIHEYCDNCGISLGRRTILYDFAWSVIDEHPELWSVEEIKNGYYLLSDHFKDFCPGYDESYDKFDVAIMNAGEYLVGGFNLLKEDILKPDLKSACSYAMFTFFKNGDFLEIGEVIEAIEFSIEELQSE